MGERKQRGYARRYGNGLGQSVMESVGWMVGETVRVGNNGNIAVAYV